MKELKNRAAVKKVSVARIFFSPFESNIKMLAGY
jgi:hypothetical protein